MKKDVSIYKSTCLKRKNLHTVKSMLSEMNIYEKRAITLFCITKKRYEFIQKGEIDKFSNESIYKYIRKLTNLASFKLEIRNEMLKILEI